MVVLNFWHIINPDALWINSDENAKRVNCKMLQLKIAMQLGFMIPHTLMSNDPIKIRKFIIDNGLNNTIYNFTKKLRKSNNMLFN